LEGKIVGLVGKLGATYHTTNLESTQSSKKQDEYVLHKILRKSGTHIGILFFDCSVNNNNKNFLFCKDMTFEDLVMHKG